MEKKLTPKGKSYYAENGAYQKEYNKVLKDLVPGCGEAETRHGELVRIIDNFVANFHEQDGQNFLDIVKEDCPECGGSGWEVTNWRDKGEPDYEEEKDDCSVCGGDCTIERGAEYNREFESEMDYIEKALKYGNPVLEKFEKFVCKRKGDDSVFDELADEIMYFVLTTENEPR